MEMKRTQQTRFEDEPSTLVQGTDDGKVKKKMEYNTKDGGSAQDEAAALRNKVKKERRKKRQTLSKGWDDGFDDGSDDGCDDDGGDPFEEERNRRKQSAKQKAKKDKKREQGWSNSKKSTKGKLNVNSKDAERAKLMESKRRAEETRKALTPMDDESSDGEEPEPQIEQPPTDVPTKAVQLKKETKKQRKKREAEERKKREEELDKQELDKLSIAGPSQKPEGKPSVRKKKREKRKRQKEEKLKQREKARLAEQGRKEEMRRVREEEENTKRELEEQIQQEEAEKALAEKLKQTAKEEAKKEKRKRNSKGNKTNMKLSEEKQKRRDQIMAQQADKAERKRQQKRRKQEQLRRQREADLKAEAELRAKEEAQKLLAEQQRREQEQLEAEKATSVAQQQAEEDNSSDESNDGSDDPDDTDDSQDNAAAAPESNNAGLWEDDFSDADESSNDASDDAAPSMPSVRRRPSHDDAFSDAESDEDDVDVKPSPPTQPKTDLRKPEPPSDNEESQEKGVNKKQMKANMRSPIGVIMGHANTGKTKILDKIRNTKIQCGESGGITQQIGATFLPSELLESQARKVDATKKFKKVKKLNIPGLLMIDTPGHESFANLRSRGSTLCDIAVLVVDIMHGIEPQTRESIKLLQDSKAPFVVALNKIDMVNTDRVGGWKASPNAPFRKTLENQTKLNQHLFNERVQKTIAEFAELGLNAALYDENQDVSLKNQHDDNKTISLVPTSAITGEGIPDLLMVITQLSQKSLYRRLYKRADDFSCTILEVKKLQGVGFCLDVILVNGTLQVGETIVMGGLHGSITTEVKALLLPKSEKVEMRVATLTNSFRAVDQAVGAMSIRIQTTGSVEHAIAGSSLFNLQKGYTDNAQKDAEDRAQQMYEDVKEKFKCGDKGVYVVASSLGSLEALLDYLRRGSLVDRQAGTWKPVPILGWDIGNVSKKIVMKASVQLTSQPKREYASILAFDVKIDKQAEQYATQQGVRIFQRERIFQLLDDFREYQYDCLEERRLTGGKAVFPVAMQIIPSKVIRAREPIILGCKILRGKLRINTPIVAAIKSKGVSEPFALGTIESIQMEKRDVREATAGQTVAVKFSSGHIRPKPMYGRHFDSKVELVSEITRSSIDVLKDNYRDQMDSDDWKLVKELKTYFDIV